jgi:hypothetical protein
MKASIIATGFVGFAKISFCGGFTSWIPRANPAALSHRALHRTQLFVSVQEMSPSNNDKKARLLKQAENSLGSSSMVDLYAELRQLSCCGYTKTKFGEVDCNQGVSLSRATSYSTFFSKRESLLSKIPLNR